MYMLGIVFIFLLLGLIIWLWYDHQLEQLEQEYEEKIPGTQTHL